MNKVDLKNYVCSVPFVSLEVDDHKRFLCCASWLKKYLPRDSKPLEAWNSTEARDIRDSILDGSYKYCDSNQCPFLHQLITFGRVGVTHPLKHKDNLPEDVKFRVDSHIQNKNFAPYLVQFSMDRSCNLECPSCRLKMFIADSKKIARVKQDIQDIEDAYGTEVTTLYITGSGDPFISVGFRDFLRNFDKTKWPKLININLRTNATKWNKKMWDSMKKVHPFVRTCEISIDAATKETYENKVRIGGNWDELMENLYFIKNISTIKSVKTSFVVQQKNFKEMKKFYDLMYSIFGNKVNIFYSKITNWGTFTEDEFKEQQVWNESHPEYEDFIKEVNSFLPNNHTWSNLQEFIIPVKNLI